jgi:hypothetical protein
MASTCFGVVGRRIRRGGLNDDLGHCADPAVIPIAFGDASIDPRRASRGDLGKAMGGAVMSPDAWEERALDSIGDRLAGSDPELAKLLATFTRLASGEEMPVREQLPARSQRAIRRSRRNRRRSHRGVERALLLLWLLITIGLITTAVTLSRNGSQSGCMARWPGICADAAPAHGSPAPVRH